MDVLSKVVVFIKSCKKLNGSERYEVKSSDVHRIELQGRNSSITSEKKYENVYNDDNLVKTDPVETSHQNMIKLSSHSKYSKPIAPLDDIQNFTSNGSCEKNVLSAFENELKEATNNSVMLDSVLGCGNIYHLWPKKQRVDKNAWNSINQLQCNQGSKDSKNPLDKTVITKQITGSCCYGLNLNSLRGSKIPCLTNSTVYLNYVNRQKISQNKTLPALSSSKHRAKPTIGKVDNHVLVDIKQEGKNKSKFQSTRSNSSKSRIKEPFIVFIKGRSRSNEEKSSRKKKLSSFGQANLNGNEVMVNRCLCHTCKCRQHSEEVLGSSTISSRSDTPPKPWAFTLRSYDKSPSPICSRKSTPEKPANHQSRMRIKPQKNLHHSVLVKDVSQTEIKYKPPFLSYTSTLKNLSNYDMMLQNRLNNSYEMPGKFMKPALNNYKYKLLRSQKTEVVSQSISSHQNLPMYHNPHLLESTTVSSNSVKTNSLNKIQRTLHQPLLSNLPLLETKVNFKIPEVSTFPRIKYKLKLKNKLGNDLTNNYLRNCGKNNFSKKGKETVIDMKTDKDAVTVSKDKKFEINPSNNGKALDCLCPDMSMHTCSSLVMEQNSCNSSKQKVNNHQDCLKKQTIMEVVDGFFNKYDNSDQSIYARTLKILKKSGYYAKFIDNLHVIDQYGFNLNNVLTSLISQKYLIGESKSQQLSEPLYQIGNIYVKQTADVIEEIENNKKIYFDSLFAFTPSSENCKIAVKCHKNQLENNEKLFWYDSNLLNNKESMSFIYDTESKNESNIGNLNSISNVESVSSQLDCTNHITSASLATLDSDFDIFESSLVEFEAACPSHLAKELEDISYKSDSFLEDQDVYKSKKERRYLRDAFKCIQTNPSFQSNFELCHPSKIKQKRLLGSTISVAEKQRSSKVSGEASAASCGPPDVNKTYHSSNSLPLFKKCSMLSKSFQNMCIPMFRQRSYSKSGDTIKKSWQSLTIAGNVQSQRSYSCFGQTSTYSPDSDQDISISTNSSFKNKSFSKYSDRDSFFSSIFASPRFKKKIRKSSLFSDSNPFEIQHTSSIDPNTLSYPLNDRKSSCLSNSFSAAHDEQEEIVNVNKYKKYHHTYRSGYSSTSPIPPLAVFSSDEDISIYPLRHVSSEPNYNTVESDNSFKRLSNLNRSHQVDTSLRFIDNKFIINRGAVKYYDNLKSSFPVSNLEWKRDLQCRLSYSRPVIKKYSAKDISCCHQKGSSCSCLISSDQFIKMMSQPYLIKAREWFSSDIYSNRLFFSLPNISAKDIGFISSNLSLQSQVSTASTRFPISSKNNSLSSNEASSNNISSLSWSLVRSKGSQNTYVEALWDFVSLDREELTFYAGDIIMVVEFPGKTWWWGKLGDKMGWFPSSHVITT